MYTNCFFSDLKSCVNFFIYHFTQCDVEKKNCKIMHMVINDNTFLEFSPFFILYTVRINLLNWYHRWIKWNNYLWFLEQTYYLSRLLDFRSATSTTGSTDVDANSIILL